MISPKDARIVILESLLVPTQFRDTLAKVLFRHFEIGSLMLLSTHLATISTLGVNSALVLDIGYKEATLIPIYKGEPILKAWQALPLGGQVVHELVKCFIIDWYFINVIYLITVIFFQQVSDEIFTGDIS